MPTHMIEWGTGFPVRHFLEPPSRKEAAVSRCLPQPPQNFTRAVTRALSGAPGVMFWLLWASEK